mmetsp:Transcript_8701/g.28653  ORF Transcript_8701/g.28653 Transcript_8701/m.28653 type:complete len:469 (+) Transcript_8701:8-1414(+)
MRQRSCALVCALAAMFLHACAAEEFALSETERGELLERLVRYCKASSASVRGGTPPTSPSQLALASSIVAELQRLPGGERLAIDSDAAGNTFVTVPAVDGAAVDTPHIAVLAHLDVSPDFASQDVKPLVHRYSGEPITITGPNEELVELSPESDAGLRALRTGDTVVTASADTLLGADDKSGVAVAVTALARLLSPTVRPIKHGKVTFVFNVDEEVGLLGAAALDVGALGAHVAYTLDGEEPGSVGYESWAAERAEIEVTGLSFHPGFSKGKTVNAVLLLSRIIAALPREGVSPETTEGREGFIQVMEVSGSVGSARAMLILRDFEEDGLAALKRRVEGLCTGFGASEPRATVSVTFRREYSNQRVAFEHDFRPVALARAAVAAVGLEPKSPPFRGGTDGSVLSLRGLPTPNLFAGWHNAHGPSEFASLDEMALSTEVVLRLLRAWADEPIEAPTAGAERSSARGGEL